MKRFDRLAGPRGRSITPRDAYTKQPESHYAAVGYKSRERPEFSFWKNLRTLHLLAILVDLSSTNCFLGNSFKRLWLC